jgi:hypothetical protein
VSGVATQRRGPATAAPRRDALGYGIVVVSYLGMAEIGRAHV